MKLPIYFYKEVREEEEKEEDEDERMIKSIWNSRNVAQARSGFYIEAVDATYAAMLCESVVYSHFVQSCVNQTRWP